MHAFFPATVYLLCFLTSTACALLLLRSYRTGGARLLRWSGLCFLLLAGYNLAVVLDLLVLPDFDFRLLRMLLALSAVSILLFGFVWDLEEE